MGWGELYHFKEKGEFFVSKIDKEKIRKLYINGWRANEIAKELNYSPSTVRTCIERNFKPLKITHEKAKQARKDIAKIAKEEVKKYMPDSTFVKKNRSIYETNKETGDIELRKDLDYAIPYDVPEVLKTEKYLSMNKEAEILADFIIKHMNERELPRPVLGEAIKKIKRKIILEGLSGSY